MKALMVVFLIVGFASFASARGSPQAGTQGAASQSGPTIVLVHGAFADSSSWDGVVARLLKRNFKVVTESVPLRGLSVDSTSLDDLLSSISGDVVLVGHSYGGQVITASASGKSQVKGLVYVDGLAPDTGESAADIGARFPGATLGETLAPPVKLSDGGKDLYIQQDRLPAQFAADVPIAKAKLMAVEQRPVTEAALNDKLQQSPAWATTPSWFIYGSLDKNITPAAHKFMASRAKSRHTVVVSGASHVVMISHPDAVVKLIVEAANASSKTQ